MDKNSYRASPPLTFGEFEQLAGIEDRAAFWARFARLPGDEPLKAARAELDQQIADRVAHGQVCLLCRLDLPKPRRWRGPVGRQVRVIPQ